MTGPTKRPDTKLECNICKKPYVKKGCLTNHLRNVHNVDNIDFVDEELKKDETFIRNAAQIETANEFLQDLSKVEDTNDTVLLDISDFQPVTTLPLHISNNTDNQPLAEIFDKLQAGVKQKNGDEPENPVDVFLHQKPSPPVQLCASAGNFLREHEASIPPLLKTAVLPTQNWEASLLDLEVEVLDILNSPKSLVEKQLVINVEEVMCEECGFMFEDKIALRSHLNIEHSRQETSTVINEETTHNCEDCGFRTQMAADLFHHTIYEHNPADATAIIREIKPVDPAVIYLLAEQNVVLGEQVKKLQTHVMRLMKKSKSDTSVMCNKCQEILTYPTRLQEHLRKEHS